MRKSFSCPVRPPIKSFDGQQKPLKQSTHWQDRFFCERACSDIQERGGRQATRTSSNGSFKPEVVQETREEAAAGFSFLTLALPPGQQRRPERTRTGCAVQNAHAQRAAGSRHHKLQWRHERGVGVVDAVPAPEDQREAEAAGVQGVGSQGPGPG